MIAAAWLPLADAAALDPPVTGAGPAAAVATVVAAFVAALGVLLDRLRRGLPVVPPRPHRPVPWGGDLVVLVFGGYLVGAALLAAALPATQPPAERLLANALLTLGVGLAAAAGLLVRGASLADLGIVGGHVRTDVSLAVAGLALVLLPLLSLAALLHALVAYEHPVVEFLGASRDGPALAVVVFAAVVAAPLAEEFFFRRVLQGWLEEAIAAPPWAPVVLSALAFGAAHAGQGLAFVPLSLLGVVLGTITRQTGSIVPCILLHALFNAVSVVLMLLQGTPPAEAG